MAAVLPPQSHMTGWPGISSHHPSNDWQPQIPHYQPPTTIPEYATGYVASSLSVPSLSVPAPHTPAARSPSSKSRRQSASQGTIPNETAWTPEMDEALIDAQSRGLRWDEISKTLFPHKSANACRKRFGRAKDERRINNWDERKIANVISAYNQDGMREKVWGTMSQVTGEKWQDIERMCFTQGLSKMTRGRGGHARRPSRQSNGHARDDSRYGSSSNDEYDAREDSGVGLGLETTQPYLPTSVRQISMTTGPSDNGLLHANHASHHYPYRQ